MLATKTSTFTRGDTVTFYDPYNERVLKGQFVCIDKCYHIVLVDGHTMWRVHFSDII